MSDFVHLNAHSCFSMMRGTAWPEDLCDAAVAAGMKSLALTDTDGLYGLIRFLDESKHRGLAPIIGAEITDARARTRAVVLVRKRSGYSGLCELISRRHLDPAFDLAEGLGDLDDNLVILADDRRLLEKLASRPGLYCEIRRTQDSHALHHWAAERGIKSVVTGDIHFLDESGWPVHRLLRAIATNSTLAQLPPREVAPPSCRFKTEAQLREEYPHLPESVDRAGEIAADCYTDWNFGRLIFPQFPTENGMSSIELLRRKCEAGIPRRYGRETPEVRQRLEKELLVIEAKHFADIFLIVGDVVEHVSLTCGRGSAAASLVSYLLFITDVDPIRHNLFFERFLNEQRQDPPDIDVDFAWDERDAVLDYIFARYGPDKTAMVSNHVCLRAKAAIREVAKVYGIPDQEIGRVARRMKMLWHVSRTPVRELLETHPMFKGLTLEEPWPEILDLAGRLEGMPRHLSVHCGGVVIVPGRIRATAPVQKTPKNVPVIQWEKDQTEDAGLVKIDILGNRSLAVIRDALAAIKLHWGVEIEYASLNPLDDEKTRALIARGDTLGVFYVESPAMRQLQKKTGTGDFEHLVIHSSIIRPAANKFIGEYVRRLHGGAWTPLHPLLEDILSETYGIMSYQEDVSKTAIALAGFDVGEADGLRKIISKKSPRRLQEYREKFFKGALERGVALETIEKIWEMILSFASYSFCKPHSASYALVSFKSAWLRSHYPAEFMAAVISNQGGFYSAFAYLSECRRMGLRILPPDVNMSDRAYKGRGAKIRVGLMQIKGLTDAGVEALIAARTARPFDSLEDFLLRAGSDNPQASLPQASSLRKKGTGAIFLADSEKSTSPHFPICAGIDPSDVRLLVKAGAFDSIANGMTRPDMMWRVHEWAASRAPKSAPSLFGDQPAQAVRSSSEDTPATEQYDAATMLKHEVQTLGFLCSRHPLDLYKDQLSKEKPVRARDLHKHVGRRVKVVGWYVTAKVVSTKDNEPMEFISFEDTSALYETVLFPEVYSKFCSMITHTRPYLLRGQVDADWGAITLNVEDVRFL